MILPHRLIAAREIAGLTITDAARSAGISRAHLSDIERAVPWRGDRPKLSTVERLARVYGRSVMFFIKEGELK